MSSGNDEAPAEGLRARKKRETRRRIVEAGIALFVAKGYEAATLEEIAAAAGISRRSFFHHFRSKDEILLSLQADIGGMIAGELGGLPRELGPLAAVRAAVTAVCRRVPAADMVVIDRLMRSSPAVQARKQASYVEQEKALFAALRERWPEPERETGLRLVALLAIGAMRLAADIFNREGGARTMEAVLDEAFDALEREMGAAGGTEGGARAG